MNFKTMARFNQKHSSLQIKQSTYLDSMLMSSISPTRRRQSNQTMREIHKHINQVPMPNPVRIRITPPLNPLIIRIPSRHIMAHQNPRPSRQLTITLSNFNRRLIERKMKRIKVRPVREISFNS